MGTWHEYLLAEGNPPEWPYPIKFGEETEYEADVCVLGGGIAGCWAAISAARNGAKVVLLEKGDVRCSGAGGPGCDHWCNVPGNPCSAVPPDEWAIEEMNAGGNYSNGIGIQIQCREDWDTLLEMEQMGGKIRDDDDKFLGVEGRDEKTKLMFSPRYSWGAGLGMPKGWGTPDFVPPTKRNNMVIRIWGSTFKPALKKECKRLGVTILDRVMATSLLNENGKIGGRIVGATGLNTRTGEFVIVKAKAVIMSAGGSGQMWHVDMEHGGFTNMYPRTWSGDSTAMAWRAGATLTMMEGTSVNRMSGQRHKWYTGGGDASYENIHLVDSNNTVLPAATQGWADGGSMMSDQRKLQAGIRSGEYELPFYSDFAGTPAKEANATWNLMLTEESTTKIMVKTMTEAGFDYTKDQVMSYSNLEFGGSQAYREANRGAGLMIDWNLKTNLDGLYAAGTATFNPGDHSFAASTGRYAGRKAAAYARGADPGKVCRDQIDAEKERVLAPTRRKGGIEWKELMNGLSRALQYFAGEYRSERTLDLALEEIGRIEKYAVPQLYALDPHKLMRSLEDLSLIEDAKIVVNAMKERRMTNMRLGVSRIDYPEDDPEDAKYYLTLTNVDGKIKFDRVPIRYWGNMKEEYEAHNPDYAGVYKPEA
ncbi:MAG: FAD-dependent oxidoreductase [Oscillospiraceae bacterium]|nr:FAD-dependent oxidoreductase [Oscillospiraceae bacterium]